MTDNAVEVGPAGEKDVASGADESSADPGQPCSDTAVLNTEKDVIDGAGHQPYSQPYEDVTISAREGDTTAGEGHTTAAAPPPSSPAPETEPEDPTAELPETAIAASSLAHDVEQTVVTSPTPSPGEVQEATVTSSKSLVDDDEATVTSSTSASLRADDVQKSTVTLSTALAGDRVQTTTVTSPSSSPSTCLHADDADVLRALTTVTSSALQTDPATEPTPNNAPETPPLETSEESEKMADTQVQVQAASPPPAGQQDHQQEQQEQQQSVVEKVPPKTEEKATCKYRWGKVVPTNCQRVIFFCSAHPKEPVFLHWSPQVEAYFSEELHVPCGDFSGHVIVEGKTYPVEAFSVRSYTFEVDLFLKEDVIEDEVATSNTHAEELKFQQQQLRTPVDTYRDISTSALTSPPKMEENGGEGESGIRHNKKYEDLLRQQLQHKDSLDASLESELAMSQKSDLSAGGSGSKRLTPVGDIDKAPFQDGLGSLPAGVSSGFEPSQSGRSSGRRTPQNMYSGSASELRQDYDGDRHTAKSSDMNSSRHSVGDPLLGDGSIHKSPSRAGSDYSGNLGSGRPTPQRELYENGSGGRPGSGFRAPVDSRIDDILGGGDRSHSSVREAPARETIGDVLGSEAILASPSHSQTSASARPTLDRELGLTGSAHSSARSTPQREGISAVLRSSPERLYATSQELDPAGEQRSLPGSHPASQAGSSSGSRPLSTMGSRPGSWAGSQQGSRTQSLTSLTSEQELSQFLDTSSGPQGSEHLHAPPNFDTHPDESAALPPIMRDRDRPTSLPTYSTQSPANVDRRLYTPDHRTWSSAAEGAMGEVGFQRELPGRMTPKSSVSSRASSRTVTPVLTNVDREDSAKVRDLEDTVATLRKLLSSREQEVHEITTQLRDLKDINQSLKKDLEHARTRRTPTGPEDMERQYQQLLQEKEILAAEVVKLRDRLEMSKGTGVDSFSSNSATSMQRRIDELEAHIRHLRHTNDLTQQKMLRSELRIKELLEENDKLRSSNALNIQDLQDDKGSRYSDRRHQIEIQQLKEDVRTLRDRNYALQEENLKLREGREPSRTVDFRSRELLRDRNPVSTSLQSDDALLQRPATESSLHHDSNLQTAEHSHSKHLPSPDQLPSPGHTGARRQLDRSYGSDSFPAASSRDPLQRSLDRNFGSDHGPKDGLGSYSRQRLEHGDKAHSSDRLARYGETSADRGPDPRRTDPSRYDLLRSRPDGEVSEKVHATDGSKYGTLSAEKLRSFDREREQERAGGSKLTMSAERLRILEEAERNREMRARSSAVAQRAMSAGNLVSSRDYYRYIRDHFGRRRGSSEREKYSSAEFSFSSSCSPRTTLSDLFATDDARHRKSETNHSDDSDSTAILMAYDAKANTYSEQREREKSMYGQRNSRSQDAYYDRVYMQEKEREKERDRDYRDLRGPYREANGEDSDTATDILLSAEPGRTIQHSHSARRKHRRSSIGDDASISSLSDGDEPQDSLRRRSRSVDTKGKKGSSRLGQTTTLRPAASTEMLGRSKTVTLSPGFRSITPQPLVTQHNKNAILQQQAALARGYAPFAPRSPGDVRIDDVVKFSRQGGKLSQGTVKFVGHLPGRSDVYLGVELYKEEGKHDGTFEAIRYFKCKPNKGVFVAFNKVVMAWAPN